MKRLLITGAGLIALAAVACAPSSRAENHTLPHGDAILLVLATQAALIAKAEADKDTWWHDTKTRSFRVQRPFAPGAIDSTHLFTVIYTIENKVVLCWSVDTRKRTVEAMGCP